jgi:hypothetical protein
VSGRAIDSTREVRAYRQTIDATPDVVFPLLCPVREAEWLDGWEYTMVYSVSGLVEEGAVFTTSTPGEEDTVWVVTRHEPAARVVEFTRFTPRSRTCVLKIAVSPFGAARSHVDVSYAYTAIAPAGSEFLAGWTEDAFLGAVVFWEKSMNHFLKADGRLSRAAGSSGQTCSRPPATGGQEG